MSRIIYINGAYHDYENSLLHVEDRATLFADAVYEVIEVKNSRQVDAPGHLERLQRSMREIRLTPDFSLNTLPFLIREVIRRNRVKNGYVYIQVSRGRAKRDFIFPDPAITPASLTIFARRKNEQSLQQKAKKGIKVITQPDIRWKRPDIKSTALIASVLARQTALEAGADEAWFYNEEGRITEGAASNAWIITSDNQLITHPATNAILKGITREGVMRAAKELNLSYSEQSFTPEEAKTASEAFISAATNLVMPVTYIDDCPINNGMPGPIAQKLRSRFHEFAKLTS